jgi:hypothetical protein
VLKTTGADDDGTINRQTYKRITKGKILADYTLEYSLLARYAKKPGPFIHEEPGYPLRLGRGVQDPGGTARFTA